MSRDTLIGLRAEITRLGECLNTQEARHSVAQDALLSRAEVAEARYEVGKANYDDCRNQLAATQQMLGEEQAKHKQANAHRLEALKERDLLRDVSAEDQRIIAHLRGQLEMLERLGMLPTTNDEEPQPLQRPYDINRDRYAWRGR